MIIERLTLDNFRQFKTKQEIEFSKNEDSNITLILGDNTSGKTTVLQAFLWCLFGKSEFKTKEQLYNIENAAEMKNNDSNSIVVKLELTHQKKKYEITRKHNIRKINDIVNLDGRSILTIIEKQSNGETRKVSDIDTDLLINEILPEELSSYFFYDTERFGNISTKRDLTSSVKGLLGLSVLENAIDHMGTRNRSSTVLWKLNQDVNLESSKDLKQLNEKQKEYEETIEKKEKEYELVSKEIYNYEGFVKEDEAKLKGLEETMILQKRRDSLDKQLKRYEKEYINETDNFYTGLKVNPVSFFATPIINTVLEELKSSDFEDKGIRDMNANSIKDIINRGKCVCGTNIEEGSKYHDELIDMIKYLPPESISTQVNHFIELIEVVSGNSIAHFESVVNKHNSILEKNKLITNIDDEVRKISEQISETVDGRGLENRIINNKNHLRSLENKLIHIQRDIEDLEKNKEGARKKYNTLLAQNNKNLEKITLLKYGDEIVSWLKNDLYNRQTRLKVQLEEKVSYYFGEIYHGNRNVEIDDSYNVTLTSGEGRQITDESAGLETVKNFSFITGLVDLAKNKLMDEVDFSNEYPLVLDAPFSNVDEKHVVNISEILPTVAEQLILIVMAKDWNYAEKNLDYRVGKKYKLVKISETNTIIKEVS